MLLNEMVEERAKTVESITELQEKKVDLDIEIVQRLTNEGQYHFLSVKWDRLYRDCGISPEKKRRRRKG